MLKGVVGLAAVLVVAGSVYAQEASHARRRMNATARTTNPSRNGPRSWPAPAAGEALPAAGYPKGRRSRAAGLKAG